MFQRIRDSFKREEQIIAKAKDEVTKRSQNGIDAESKPSRVVSSSGNLLQHHQKSHRKNSAKSLESPQLPDRGLFFFDF